MDRTRKAGSDMQTSLRGIANKAKRERQYRFQNLYVMLNEQNLRWCWGHLNKRAASGIDGVTAREYERDLEGNIGRLVEGLKRKYYRAKMVRRRWIPKEGGKKRPLGIPAVQDKVLQLCVSQILGAIYEQDFLGCSYGYRPGVGARDAVRDLTRELQFGRYGYVVEADIRGFFDSIDHEWMMRMLEERVDDRPFLRLIRKWLKAGVLEEDGQVIHPVTGCPQGGIVSPILANIYLHYVLDVWFERVVKRDIVGRAYLCRYADDFVCAFEHKADAEAFYRALGGRLSKFGLEVSEEKTRVVRFSRQDRADSGRFDFLGFEYSWGVSRKGQACVQRRTSRRRLRASLKRLAEWCRSYRNWRLDRLFWVLNAKLRGYYNYYGVIGNYGSLREFYTQALRILYKWLNRRSERRSYNWTGFQDLVRHFSVERPRITERRTTQRMLPGLC
jgi:group II intron reverse transcriptase/maturase